MAEIAPSQDVCVSCGGKIEIDEGVLDLGLLPPCNRFSKVPDIDGRRHRLQLAECPHCELVQLVAAPPAEFVVPRVPWIRYNEPEAHLGEILVALKQGGLSSGTRVAGIGPFDVPLLSLCSRLECTTLGLDLAAYRPHGAGEFPYLETIQGNLEAQVIDDVVRKHGQFDVVSCRYLLEHAHHPLDALRSMGRLVRPGGLLLVEVPDSSKFVRWQDYSFIWEEHICYFTENTVAALLREAGFDCTKILRFEGQLEDALVITAKHANTARTGIGSLHEPSKQFLQYREGLVTQRLSYKKLADQAAKDRRKIAIFGAGHQAVMFINVMELPADVFVAIDDDSNKAGCYIPGTKIRIELSERLSADPAIGLCLLAIHPRIEAKIMDKCSAFRGRGGQFRSIFPGSTLGLAIDSAL